MSLAASGSHSATNVDNISTDGKGTGRYPVSLLGSRITLAEASSIYTYNYSGPRSLINVNGTFDGNMTPGVSSLEPISLTLLTPDTHARNWELYASSIWAASVFLADHFQEFGLDSFVRASDQRFQVLELGAGAGLPGLLTAKYLKRIEQDGQTLGRQLKSWRVTLSDYPDELLIEALRGNVKRNGFDDSPSSSFRVVPYPWGEDTSAFFATNDNAGQQGFDFITAADTLWNPRLHEAFARTLYRLLRPSAKARIHLVAGLHTGRYAIAGFLRTVQSTHFSSDNDAGRDLMSLTRDWRRLEVLCHQTRNQWRYGESGVRLGDMKATRRDDVG